MKTNVLSENSEEMILPDQEQINVLELLRPGRFDIRKFHEDFVDNSARALEMLLNIQDNENPLKKGGDQIAFRCDLFLLLNRQHYTVKENTLLDIICGFVSSRPNDTVYVIRPKDIGNCISFEDPKYIYKVFKEGHRTLVKKPLIFEIDGEDEPLYVSWNHTFQYKTIKNNRENEDFIIFRPTDFFKMLLLSATVVHGAFYRIGVSSQIQARYARTLYYLLVSRRKYKATPSSPEGNFSISADDFQKIIGYPDSYRSILKRRVLDVCKDAVDSIAECDFTFDYKLIKNNNGWTTHISFSIRDKGRVKSLTDRSIREQERIIGLAEEDAKLMLLLSPLGITEKECVNVIAKYRKYKRDIPFLKEAVENVNYSKNVRSKAAVLQYLMENGLTPLNKGNFCNIESHDYDMDELEKLLINN